MKYSYDITGAEAIIRDHLVYDATNLDQGELLMKDTTATEPGRLITAYTGTAANDAVDAAGILNESTYEVGGTTPDTATGSGGQYGKVIINPFAIYQVEQNIGTSYDVAITSTATTTLTVASLQDNIDFCWVYFPLTSAGVKGSLRLLTASASGSATMDSALTNAGTASDTVVVISTPLAYSLPLTADAKKVGSGNCQATIFAATNIRVLQVYIDKDAGLEAMKPGVHAGLNNLDNVKGGNGPKFYYDVMLKDHLFGVQE